MQQLPKSPQIMTLAGSGTAPPGGGSDGSLNGSADGESLVVDVIVSVVDDGSPATEEVVLVGDDGSLPPTGSVLTVEGSLPELPVDELQLDPEPLFPFAREDQVEDQLAESKGLPPVLAAPPDKN